MASGAAKKNMAKQRKAVEAEAEAAGFTLSALHEIVPEEIGHGSAVKGALKAIVGGSLETEATHVYELDGPAGRHFFLQGYSGTLTLPGEHHAKIAGAPPASFKVVQPWLGHPDQIKLLIGLGLLSCGLFLVAAIVLGWRNPKVVCEDAELQARLRKNDRLNAALKGLKFQWGAGLSVIELDWALQVRPLGEGRSEVVMATGRYGGFTTYKVGMQKFQDILAALPDALAEETAGAEAPFLEPTRFSPELG